MVLSIAAGFTTVRSQWKTTFQMAEQQNVPFERGRSGAMVAMSMNGYINNVQTSAVPSG